ncbi:MAG: flavodoxin, short chain [Oscillospiraceae bacterium]|jgi:flavodoxin short chain|nr:flavodoxin, short chain [Oscillospiraceae bacterium]
MKKIAIVYWSGTGNTEAMANEIANGAKEAGAEVSLFTSADFTADKVSGFDALAFGCPSMGAEQLEETEFGPMFDAVERSLSGKSVALFGSYGWGDGQWMRDWQARCNDADINLVSDGLIINEAPDDNGIAQCRALGKSLA